MAVWVSKETQVHLAMHNKQLHAAKLLQLLNGHVICGHESICLR